MCYVIVLTGDLAILVKGVDIPQRISILFTEAYMLFNKTIKLFITFEFLLDLPQGVCQCNKNGCQPSSSLLNFCSANNK